MSGSAGRLPSFQDPPVSEVALGIEFSPLEHWRSAHAGLYWGEIRDEYPNTDIQPPLASQIETFENAFWPLPSFHVQIGNPEVSRFWFLAEPATNLIQVQRDRFIVNWRKVTGDEVYPRYDADLRPRFVEKWDAFCKFVDKQKLGEITVQQCEVTYVNDILQGEGWESFEEGVELFEPWWKPGSDKFLPLPELLNLAGAFRMPDDKGRLHFACQAVSRAKDNRRAIQLRLTARGKPRSGAIKDILHWMDLGHEWVVRGFSDLTSKHAHKLWKRQS